MKIGLICAMDKEAKLLLEKMENKVTERVSGMEFTTGTFLGCPVVLSVCGIGKVNAAMGTQTLILRYAPDCIINTGVAGGIGGDLHLLDTVLATELAHHDFDTSPIGDPYGYVYGADCVRMPTDNALCEKLTAAAESIGMELKRGLIVSGDQFIASKAQIDAIHSHYADAIASEMEGAAVGQVCTINKVPFAVLRAISDGGNDEAKMDYPQFVLHAVDRFVALMTAFFSALGK